MTDHPHGMLSQVEYQTHIRVEADRLIATIDGKRGRMGKAVVSCPGWTLRELVEHLGGVHQWARGAIVDPDSGPKQPTTPPADGEDLAQWYDRCVTGLLATLHANDPTTPCWTFQEGNRVVGFWSRRQAHELAMHRVDAEVTAGGDATYEPALAVDGIAEVFDVFVHRRHAWNVPPLDLSAPVLFDCVDRPERWLVMPTRSRRFTDGAINGVEYTAEGPVLAEARAAQAAVSVRGRAADLLLAIWRRTNFDAAEVLGDIAIEGDAAIVRRLLESRMTP